MPRLRVYFFWLSPSHDLRLGMDGICSLHSVTTGSRDRANVVPLIIIIIIIIIKYYVYHNPIKQNPSFYAQYYPYKILLIYVQYY